MLVYRYKKIDEKDINLQRKLAYDLLNKEYTKLNIGVMPSIIKDAHGKPHFIGLNKLEFSISHTKTAIAVAISDRAVGIDIENVRNFRESLVDRVFCIEEKAGSEQFGDDKLLKNVYFTKLWTKKEAFSKAIGLGIGIGFRGLNFSSLGDSGEFEYNKDIYRIKSFFEDSLILSIAEKVSSIL